jgi:ribonuclease HI
MEADLYVFVDGGCTANPGGDLAVAAVLCSPDGEIVLERARRASVGTSNVAEYRALRYGICMANLLGARRPAFVSDSELMVRQVNGWWAMSGDSPLHAEHKLASSALMGFEHWWLSHVSRERNRRADWLVCKLLGHSRALKNPPDLGVAEAAGAGHPGWVGI